MTAAVFGHLARTMEFLNSIGIPVAIEPGAKGFIDLLRIEAGGIKVDPACPPSNLLHEAGHLAILPSRFRGWAQGNLSRVMAAMAREVDFDADPDSLDIRAAMNCSDPEATAWAWAAGRHLGIPEELIVLDAKYEGSGRSIRTMLSLGRYAGIHGLAHGGFCVTRPGQLEEVYKLPAYPRLARWTQL